MLGTCFIHNMSQWVHLHELAEINLNNSKNERKEYMKSKPQLLYRNTCKYF